TGRLHANHADTPLGRLATRGAGVTGDVPGTVMLRPEQILCREPDADGRTRGRVLATQFYGHDATARIALEEPAAPEITARAAGHRVPRIGEQVSVVVEGTALAYPSGRYSIAGERSAMPRPRSDTRLDGG